MDFVDKRELMDFFMVIKFEGDHDLFYTFEHYSCRIDISWEFVIF